jgi:hypothetical protein
VRARIALALAALLWSAGILTPSVRAQPAQSASWTVQTAAFIDYRQASMQVGELLAMGLDAYVEFAMSDGTQYARVRIGCFAGRDAAETFARDIRGRLTAEAVAQPLNQGAAVAACVSWDPGFIKPPVWRVERVGADIVFAVEVGGLTGYLQHAGGRWRFSHSVPTPPTVTHTVSPRFREVHSGGLSLVQTTLDGGTTVTACAGDLLWQRDRVAVVERASRVIACVVDETAVETVEGGAG